MTSDNEMNNQAAQTMPELPKPFQKAVIANRINTMAVRQGYEAGGYKKSPDLYTADQMRAMYQQGYAAALAQTAGVAEVGRVCKWHQQDEGYDTFSTGCGHEYTVNECTDGNVQLPYCPFCAKPLIGIAWNEDDDVSLSEAPSSPNAAAPAASGVDTSTNEAWAARAQEKIAAMEAASVSERARELRERAEAHGGGVFVSIGDIRAIEQALTQQRVCATCGGRGEIGGHVGQTAETFDYVTEPCPECTTPQPSADAVREVPDGMVLVPREPTEVMVEAGAFEVDYDENSPNDNARNTWLAMLSAASGEKGWGDG